MNSLYINISSHYAMLNELIEALSQLQQKYYVAE